MYWNKKVNTFRGEIVLLMGGGTNLHLRQALTFISMG